MSSKLKVVRKGHPRSKPFAQNVDRLHNNIFDIGGTQLTPAESGESSSTGPIIPGLTPASLGLKSSATPYELAAMELGAKQHITPQTISQNAGGLSKGVTAGIKAGAPIAGGIINKSIAGGYDDGGVGAGIASVGSAIGAVIPNPIVGAAITIGANAIGGLYSRAFGSKMNKENIANINSTINSMNQSAGELAAAKSNESLLNSWGNAAKSFNFSNRYVGKDGWAANKAKKTARNLRKQMGVADATQTHALGIGVQNADAILDSNVMRQSFAYGGNLNNQLMQNIFDMGGPKKKRKGYYSEHWDEKAHGTETTVYPYGSNDIFVEMATPTDTLYQIHHGTVLNTEYGSKTKAGETPNYKDLRRKFNQAKSGTKRSYNIGLSELRDGIVDFIEGITPKNINFQAYGGPVEVDPSTAIGYAMYTDKYVNDASRINNKNMTNMFAGTSDNILSLGGVVQTKGMNLGKSTHVNTGGTHEENQYDGVQVGVDRNQTPNLVEEGEVIYDDYVFSNRLIVPKHKYAKGGKLKNKEDIPYEQKVLKPYEGLTFAEAAKRIEQKSGAAERPTDVLALRGMEAGLSVLRDVQEKEREIEKLQEMQDAIANMTPEEFAMLQQQMQAGQEQQAQQEAAMQQQQMIPQGMEQMQYPMEEPQPIAALGGLLNTPDKKLFYDGGWTEYKNSLKSYGVNPEQYLTYLNSSLNEQLTLDQINNDNFNRNDIADKYLKYINKTRRNLIRQYKKKGVNINSDKLNIYAIEAFNNDLRAAIDNPELLESDGNKQLTISRYTKGSGNSNPDRFNKYAVSTARDNYLGKPLTLKNEKLPIQYNDEDTTPAGIPFLDNTLTWDADKKQWKDNDGKVVDNPYIGDYGFSDLGRDWSTYGYIDKDNNWQTVEPPIVNTSGNTPLRFTPSNKWAKDLGDAGDYELTDEYIDNYIDFIQALNNDDPEALKRLYTLGESAKSNNPKELRGQNRYFKDGVDSNNLSKNDLRRWGDADGLFGTDNYNNYRYNLDEKNTKFYKNDKDEIIREGSKDWNELSEDQQKKYTPIENTDRKVLRDYLRQRIVKAYNDNENARPNDLLAQSIFDNVWGQHHLIAPRSTNRYVLVDAQGNPIKKDDKLQYVAAPTSENQYTLYKEGTPLTDDQFKLDANGVNINTIGVLGGNVDNYIGVRKGPDGNWISYRLTPDQAEKLKGREIASDDKRYSTLPQFEAAVSGYNFTPHYYELDDDAYKSLGFDSNGYSMNDTDDDMPFPKAPSWPYWAAGALQLGALGYNILSPKDYRNADAMINAAMTAGKYMPISFRPIGNYLTYNPMDVWRQQNRMDANSRATDRAIINNAGPLGTQMAGLLANSQASQLGSAELAKTSEMYNDALEKQVAEYNRDTDKFNSEGFLKADMANQDAATRARGFTLEGLKNGYAMRQAIDDARANAINVGISGLANLMLSGAQNDYANKLTAWRLQHNPYAISQMEGDDANKFYKNMGYSYNPSTGESLGAKGSKLKRKKKGLSF